MKRRKLNSSLLTQLEDLRKTRNSIDEYYYNFLVNISKYTRFMHYVIDTKPENGIIQIPIAQFLISLISCWETYMRDIFIFIAEKDKLFRDSIISSIKLEPKIINQIDSDLLLAEYLSKLFNFQNLNDIENAFQPVFKLKLFNTIGNYEIAKSSIKARPIKEISISKLFPSWKTTIEKAYSERHKIVHDANYIKEINIDISFIQLIETIFVIFPQIFAIFISKKYQLDHQIINMNFDELTISIDNINEDSVPFIFLVEDLIVDDWIVASDIEHVDTKK